MVARQLFHGADSGTQRLTKPKVVPQKMPKCLELGLKRSRITTKF